MKEQMNSESKLFLHVDLNDIFSSSYKCLIDKPKEELLKKFYIIFEPSSSTIGSLICPKKYSTENTDFLIARKT